MYPTVWKSRISCETQSHIIMALFLGGWFSLSLSGCEGVSFVCKRVECCFLFHTLTIIIRPLSLSLFPITKGRARRQELYVLPPPFCLYATCPPPHHPTRRQMFYVWSISLSIITSRLGHYRIPRRKSKKDFTKWNTNT